MLVMWEYSLCVTSNFQFLTKRTFSFGNHFGWRTGLSYWARTKRGCAAASASVLDNINVALCNDEEAESFLLGSVISLALVN